MASAKATKVKDLAGKYGLSPKDVIRELIEQGGLDNVKNASSTIPPESLEIAELICEELAAKKHPKKETAAAAPAGAEVTITPPIVVKALAEALGLSLIHI